MTEEADEMPHEELAALHVQIASLQRETAQGFGGLTDRLERMELSLVGDREVGLRGMVDRVNRIEDDSQSASDTHEGIEQRRRDGDARIHERIDKLEGKWRLAVGMAIGASIGSAGGAAALVKVFGG